MNVAFYSYKGGVGRTQLVANLAQYLYKYENKKVLLMDWDLEAPGLHFYFDRDNKEIQRKGIIDVLSDYVKFARETEADEAKEEDFPFFTEENIINLDKDEETGGRIDLIAGGVYNDFQAYRRKIIDFNWIEFYELLDGVRYVEFVVKKKLKELDYDFIFIDSRTGISDYQNICNIQLADANILLMAPNKQNVEGCMEVAKSIIDSPYVKDGHREAIILPILSRVEVDSPDFKKFNDYFKKECDFLIDNLNEKGLRINKDLYYEMTRLYYNKFIAINEHLLFKEKEDKLEGFQEIYEEIAKYIIFLSKDTATKIKTLKDTIPSMKNKLQMYNENLKKLTSSIKNEELDTAQLRENIQKVMDIANAISNMDADMNVDIQVVDRIINALPKSVRKE